MKKYVVQRRYEWLSRDGVKWTNWFVYDDTKYDEDIVEEVIKDAYDSINILDKKTGFHHEFRKYDADTYDKEFHQRLEDNKKNKIAMDKLREMSKQKKKEMKHKTKKS